jgi:hypothetical protein
MLREGKGAKLGEGERKVGLSQDICLDIVSLKKV